MYYFFILSIIVTLFLSGPIDAAESNPEVSNQPESQSQPVRAEAQTQAPIQEPKKNDYLEQAQDFAKKTTEQVSNTLSGTRERREKANYFALANYSPIDLLIPSKIGITLGSIRDANKTWELEYLRGSIAVPFLIADLGKMTDTRISLIGRSYFGGNSFNFSYGLSYFNFSIHLGDKLLNRLTAGSYPSIDLVEVQSVGFNLAIGNRWSFNRNITFGVDWISWAQPVYATGKKSAFLDYANNQEDKDNVDKAIKLISYFPRVVLFKLQFGILF